MFSADQKKRNFINLNTLEMENKTTKLPQNEALNIGVVSSRCDVWNPMIKLIQETKNPEVCEHAKMLLKQYNTASGIRIKHELDNYLVANGY